MSKSMVLVASRSDIHVKSHQAKGCCLMCYKLYIQRSLPYIVNNRFLLFLHSNLFCFRSFFLFHFFFAPTYFKRCTLIFPVIHILFVNLFSLFISLNTYFAYSMKWSLEICDAYKFWSVAFQSPNSNRCIHRNNDFNHKLRPGPTRPPFFSIEKLK